MYTFVLALHSWIRWVVLILAVITIVRAFIGWFGNKEWTKSDLQWASRFAMIVSLQFVIGVILYFMSPTIEHIMSQDMGEVMKNSHSRKLLLEHPVAMIIALALVHIGKSKAKKASAAIKSHKMAAIFFLIAVVIMLASIPWGTSEMFRQF